MASQLEDGGQFQVENMASTGNNLNPVDTALPGASSDGFRVDGRGAQASSAISRDIHQHPSHANQLQVLAEFRTSASNMARRDHSTLQDALFIFTLCGPIISTSFFGGALLMALPSMQRELNIPNTSLHWPLDAFYLANGVLNLPLGHFADSMGCRIPFLAGALLCALTALALVFSRDLNMLIAFSVIYGASISLSGPASMGLLASSFGVSGSKRKNVAYGLYGASFYTGYGFGLLIGGVLTSSRGGWRAAMGVLSGIAFAYLITAYFLLPVDGSMSLAQLANFDWIGSSLAVAGLSLLTFAVSDSSSAPEGWKTPYIPALLPVSAVLLLLFLGWERRLENQGRQPVMPLSVWRRPQFAALSGIVALNWWSYNATLYFVNLYWQNVKGYSPVQTAVSYIPTVIVALACSAVCSWALANVSSYGLIVASCILIAVGPLLLAFVQPYMSYWALEMPCVLLTGFVDLMYPVLVMGIQTSVPPNQTAMAGAVYTTVARVASAVGLAISTAIVNSQISTDTGASGVQNVKAYHTAGWISFAVSSACVVLAVWSLRGMRRVGALEKQDKIGAEEDVYELREVQKDHASGGS